MKKILAVLTLIITLISCESYDATRDAWVVSSVRRHTITSNKCTYSLKNYHPNKNYTLTTDIYDIVGKYEVGDTLILVKK